MWKLITGFLMYVRPAFWFRLLPLLLTKSYKSGRHLVDDWMRDHWITIGIMQFMDPYNFDVDRAQGCCLHYGVPDKESKARLIPFCAMNNIHRRSIEEQFSVKIKAEKKKGRRSPSASDRLARWRCAAPTLIRGYLASRDWNCSDSCPKDREAFPRPPSDLRIGTIRLTSTRTRRDALAL